MLQGLRTAAWSVAILTALGGASVAGDCPDGLLAASRFVENGGVGVRINVLRPSPDGKHLNASAEVVNTSEGPIFVAMVGPAPAAMDDSGVAYTLDGVQGIATCSSLAVNSIDWCMSNFNGAMPGGSFLLLQPGASANVQLSFAAPEVTRSGFASLSVSLAVGYGERPTNKATRTLENVAIAFPVVRFGD